GGPTARKRGSPHARRPTGHRGRFTPGNAPASTSSTLRHCTAGEVALAWRHAAVHVWQPTQRSRSASMPQRLMAGRLPSAERHLLPSPLWGGVGGGGRERWHGIAVTSRSPSPTPPHKGGRRRVRATRISTCSYGNSGVCAFKPPDLHPDEIGA